MIYDFVLCSVNYGSNVKLWANKNELTPKEALSDQHEQMQTGGDGTKHIKEMHHRISSKAVKQYCADQTLEREPCGRKQCRVLCPNQGENTYMQCKKGCFQGISFPTCISFRFCMYYMPCRSNPDFLSVVYIPVVNSATFQVIYVIGYFLSQIRLQNLDVGVFHFRVRVQYSSLK